MARPIKTILPTLIADRESWKFTLLSNWPKIIGNLSNKVCLEKVQDDTLVLGVYDSCWLQELYLLSHLLITTINQHLDQPRIKHLRFKKAARPKVKKESSSHKKNAAHYPVILKLSEKAALKRIQDPQLREALERFLIRCYKEK